MDIREQLNQIQKQLKEVFPASDHKARQIPGSDKKWIYLPWQVIRDRLDAVCVDWEPNITDVQYYGNEAICRYSITILGVKKQVLASVPLTITSSKGNEMTRGSVTDRLAAEGLKNAAECWGVGRYLDDQERVIKYLWEHKIELTDEMAGELQKLMQQYKSNYKPQQTISPSKAAPQSSKTTISDAQSSRLWAIAKGELKLSNDDVKAVLAEFKYDSTKDIAFTHYEIIIERLRDFAANF